MKYPLSTIVGVCLIGCSVCVYAQQADKYYDSEAIQDAREAMRTEMGGQLQSMILIDRLEYWTNEGTGLWIWDAQAWFGSDINKIWFKSDGEIIPDRSLVEELEYQALYSRAISPYFDLQLGYRQVVDPHPSRHFAVLGIEGIAPYWFELDTALFISDDGDVSARIEAEYELFLTQRLILEPRAELDLSFQDVPEFSISAGLTTAEAGLRLRYEVRREIAPYAGIVWRQFYGDTADSTHAMRLGTDTVSFVAGIRIWF